MSRDYGSGLGGMAFFAVVGMGAVGWLVIKGIYYLGTHLQWVN